MYRALWDESFGVRRDLEDLWTMRYRGTLNRTAGPLCSAKYIFLGVDLSRRLKGRYGTRSRGESPSRRKMHGTLYHCYGLFQSLG